jgi:hypothetical protein
MKRLVLLLLVCLVAGTTVSATGTLVATKADVGGGVTRVTLAWTSTSGGAVSGNAVAVPWGELLQVKFVPNLSTTQPSDQYDVTLVDTASVDYLAGLGANLSNATASIVVPRASTSAARFFLDGSATLDLVVANAGSAKTGTVILWIGR